MSRTIEQLKAFGALQAKQVHVIEEQTLPNQAYKRLCQSAGTFTIEWYAAFGGPLLFDYQTTQMDEAADVYDGIDGVPRPWDQAYLPRGGAGQDGKTMQVFAVGADPRGAIEGFLDSHGTQLGSIEALVDEDGESDFQWSARVASKNGHAFKVAGRYVPGGAVLVWWK